MTLNSRRRWCFISKYEARWTVFLTILYVWCIVCGGTSSITPTTAVSTANEVCIIRTKASITTAMTPKQNKCIAVTFTTTSPTTTDSTSIASTTEASTENAPSTTATGQTEMSSSMTTKTGASTTIDVIPTTTLISSPSTTAPSTATNVDSTTTAPSTETEASTTIKVTPTTTLISSPSTTAPSTATNADSTTTAPSTETEASTTIEVTPTTTLISSPSTTAPSTATNADSTTTAPSTETEASTTIEVTPQPLSYPHQVQLHLQHTTAPSTATNADSTTTAPLTENEASTTIEVTPTTTLISSPSTTAPSTATNADSTTTAPLTENEASTTIEVTPTTTLISSPSTTAPSTATNADSTTTAPSTETEASTTIEVTPTTTLISSPSTTAPSTATNADSTTTAPLTENEASTTIEVTPTTTLISSPTTNADSTTTAPLTENEASTTIEVTPTTTLISSPSTTAPSTATNADSTTTAPLTENEASTTIEVTPTTTLISSPSTTAPSTATNADSTTTAPLTENEASTTIEVTPTTTLISSPSTTAPSTATNADSTTTAPLTENEASTTIGDPTTTLISSPRTTAPSTATNADSTTTAPLTENEASTTIEVTPTTTLISSPTTNADSTTTAPSTETEASTTIGVTPTTTLISSPSTTAPSTATNADSTTTAPLTENEASTTIEVTPQPLISSPRTTAPSTATNADSTTTAPLTENEASTTIEVTPTTTLISSPTTNADSTTTAPLTENEASTTIEVTPTTTLISSPSTTAPSTATNADSTTTAPLTENEASTTIEVTPTTTLISSPPTNADSTTTAPLTENEASTTIEVTPTTTLISSPSTTAPSTATNADSTTTAPLTENEASTTIEVTPTTTLISSPSTTEPSTATNAASKTTAPSIETEASTTIEVTPTTTLISSESTTTAKAAPTTPLSTTNEGSTTTAVNPTSTPFSLANSSPPITTRSAAPTSSSVSKGYTTTAVTLTSLRVFSGPTIAPPATENAGLTTTLLSISPTSSLVSPSTTTISPTTIPLFTKTRTAAATTFVTPTTMPMLSEFTKSFLTSSSLMNATTNAVTPTRLSETQNPAPTAFVSQSTKTVSLATTETTAPTIIIVTQETTMPLSMSATAATVASTKTTAVVASKLLFNSSSPVTSESQVLRAINTLLKSRESQLSESVKVINVNYEKISETSYAVVITFSLVNISMPEDPELRGDTYQQVQDTINNALNTLLNEPGKNVFEPKSSNFMSSSNQIDGRMDYTFQDGDAIQPVSFLNELRLPTTTTVPPERTTSFSVTTPNLISGSAMVTSKLEFNSSSPVPSEDLVLSAINTLRNSRESQLNESVKVVNVIYQKISETSYAVIFTFNVINISMSEDPELRRDTNQQVQDIINNALNTLLNEPGKNVFEPKSSNFMSSSNQIDGRMDYTFQDGDAIQPVSFLNELRLPTTTTVPPERTTSFSVTTPNLISGSAMVTSKLEFNSSSPVPSEDLVLSAINTLRNSRESQLNESVKVVNVIYQKISETSYAVIFTFNVINISMSEDPELRRDTNQQVQDIINNALNTLLNEPGKNVFEPKSSNFMSSSNQIDGRMDYTFQDGDAIQPVSFLNELRLPTTTTVPPERTTSFSVTTPNLISGSAMVTSKLEFNSSSPVPSEDRVLSAINTLRNSRESQLNESVKVVNVIYQKISETSYAVIFTFNVINISMSKDPELRRDTNQQVQDIINNALNTLLNEPGKNVFEPKSSNFMSSSNQIDGRMDYTFQDGDAIQPVSFLNELRLPTTTTVPPERTTSFSVTTPNLISGSAMVTSKLEFNSSSPVPSEDLVLSAINTLRNSRESQLNESVKVVNVIYQKISETSYAVIFTFNVINISMSEDPELRRDTNQQVQDIINNALNTLLNEPGKNVFEPKSSNFMSSSNQIDGRMDYTFQDGDAIQPVSFLNELRLPTTTTTTPTSKCRTSSITRSGSAMVTSKLEFNSSSPVPSEDLVLSAINTLRNSRESQLNESVKVVNVIYQKISETSYAVIFTFNVINISMSKDPELRRDTNQQVQDIINNALNTLLNEPGKNVFEPKSSNFMSSSNQIDGRMDYTFQDGDAIQPVSFLNELRLPTTTTVPPERTTSFSVTTPNLISGSAMVTSKLEFNSSSPVPSEDLVLSAINTLRNSRESQLNESVKVVNVIYQKISETSYAVIFTFNVINISMSEDPELRRDTNQQVQDIINNALNTLLNEPGKNVFEPKSSNFMSSSNQIDGRMDYTFQDGDAIQPVSFLNELRLPTTTTVPPERTTSFSVTTPNLISGSAMVTSKLEFNSSSPVPSEDLVLSAINTLRNSRESQLNESVKVVNVIYQKISETSYAVIFTFNVINISMSEDPELRRDTNQQVQDIINNALNTLLNELRSPTLQPNSSNFTSTSNQIDGRMEYTFQDGDAIQPVSFLNELRVPTSTTVLPERPTSFSVTTLNLISGSAMVISKLEFNSSSPVPSEDLVLSAINTLRNSRESQLNESVKVVHVTYEKITATSYAVIFKFNLSNISMSKDPELRNGTYLQAQGVINNALNTLLNEPGRPTLNPKSSNFISTSNQIDGRMDYTFQDKDAIQPVSFLNELRSQTASTLTTTPPTVRGRALISIRLVFVTLGPLPNPDKVLEVVNNMLKTRLTTKQDTTTQDLSDSVNFANVTYTKINETAYALNFGFEISNITMSGKLELRNGTHLVIQDSINSLLGKILLSNSSAPLIKFQAADFKGNSTVIQANVEYVFSPSDITQPSIFVQQLLQLAEASSLTTTSPPILTRRAIIKIRLEFITLGPRPSEKSVLDVVKSMLASNLTTKQTARTVSVSDPVTVDNVIYLGINDTAYALIFTFEINKVSLTELKRNETYQVIQKKINDLVIKILKDPSVNLLIPAEFKDNLTVIEANVMFVFSQHDSNSAAGYLVSTLFKVFTTPVPTTMNTTISNNGTNVAWIVAIIVPCAIVIGLVPCWILLCCLLCGCCAAIRRRWHRRQSYNVQYTTRNSLF
ncbi:uncharacterized protein wu:fc34e06 [Onychostoma macrolepis]|uniref:uncharacterized protein wu:fc34e06 n=1 Tax=Onychostoma macrolepis TaxID=369639 RepID=UPI00272CF5E8|nr:uncharacterized protein wu:fc34e06 [Onychostoma macrolepis]